MKTWIYLCTVGGITIIGAVILVICSVLNGDPDRVDDAEHPEGLSVCIN